MNWLLGNSLGIFARHSGAGCQCQSRYRVCGLFFLSVKSLNLWWAVKALNVRGASNPYMPSLPPRCTSAAPT